MNALKRRLRVLLLVLATALAAGPAAAQPTMLSLPEDELSVFHLVMGQGDQVWEKFGHDALWIHDPIRGTDRVYNYGVFDFRAPGYWGRFVRGNWIYQLAVDDVYQTVGAYQYWNRTLVAQELNLTREQKAELQAFLDWNYLPENREYRYDYFLDNCSTRIRDALDRVLKGQLRAATERVPTGTTFRSHSRRLIADDVVAYTGMNAGLGPPADREISQWEEMFLPGKVGERLRALRVATPDGGFQPLVRAEHVIYEATGRAPERETPPNRVPIFLLAGVGIGGVVVALGRAAATSRGARHALAGVTLLWSLLMGVGGLLLLALWALTDHQVAHRNENLFQLSPLSVALLVLAPAAVYGARWALRPARWVALAVAALSLLGFVLQPLPGLDQVNAEVIALALPVHLALAWVLDRRGGRREAEGSSGLSPLAASLQPGR